MRDCIDPSTLCIATLSHDLSQDRHSSEDEVSEPRCLMIVLGGRPRLVDMGFDSREIPVETLLSVASW
jgi:hypothetical protein